MLQNYHKLVTGKIYKLFSNQEKYLPKKMPSFDIISPFGAKSVLFFSSSAKIF